MIAEKARDDNNREMSRSIEAAIGTEDWKKARRLIRIELQKKPDSHWLLSRLALTFYEERDYSQALIIERKAYKLQPKCPLVLWGLAGTLEMLGQYQEAIVIFRRLAQRGIDSIAFDECGEGIAQARGLVADCWYRLASCARQLRRRAQALKYYQRHLAMRGAGCRSIYKIRDVRKELREFGAAPTG